MSDKEVISAFEAWAQHPDRPHKLPIDKHPNGAYTDARSYVAWYGWLSAVKHMSPPVSPGYHWQPMSTCPLGTSVLLKGQGGTPTQGQYSGAGDDFWIGWAHFPTDKKGEQL